MIPFSCSQCGKGLKVKDEFAGRKTRCPGCGNPLVVPQPAVNRASKSKPGSASVEDARTLPPEAPADTGNRTLAPNKRSQADKESLSDSGKQTDLWAGSEDRGTQAPSPEGANPELWDFLAPAEKPDEIGRLGTYRVLQVLGAGGMGVVFRAEDPHLERLIALKAMLPALASSSAAKQRFFREAKSAAALKHPHIVTIFQVGEDRGAPFLAMEFLEGAALDGYLKQHGKPALAEQLRIGREIAEGLAAAHAKGLIHRDIKPANIWLEGTKAHVKILDFGLARAMGDQANLTQSGAIIGTPAYMAPEQVGGKQVDHRCDLFSLGCVLYRMCTGEMPFKGDDTLAVLSALALETPPAPRELDPQVPRGLSDLIQQLLAKKADDRPATAGAVVERITALEKEQDAHPPASPPRKAARRIKESPPEPTQPLPRPKPQSRRNSRRPLLLAGVGGLAVLLLLGAILLFWPTPKGTIRIEINDPDSREIPEAGVKDGWQRLFTGNDLGDWEGLTKYWTVKENVLVGSSLPDGVGFNTFLCSKKKYRDFELKFGVRLKGAKANSGVQIRSELTQRERFRVVGPQVDMGDPCWGSLYGEGWNRWMKKVPQEKVAPILKNEDFNDFFIRCSGKHVLVQMNGLTTVDDDFPDLPADGIIAWQIHRGPGMEVAFRDVQIKELREHKGWATPFTGNDLSGWETVGEGKWTVQDGILRTQGDPKPGWLATPRDYGDFELELDYRLPPKGNSGVFVHAWKEAPVSGIQFLEIQLIDDNINPHGKNHGTAAICNALAPTPTVKTIPNTWHKLAIRSQGRRLLVSFDNQQVLDTNLDDLAGAFQPGLKKTTGRIGLQQFGTPVEFRNVRLRPLSVAAAPIGGSNPWVVYEGTEGPGKGKHIVLVSGDEEYRSEEALPQLAKILATHHGFQCTVLFAIDKDGAINPNISNIPGLEALKTADLMILSTRHRDLPDEQMKHIVDYVESGKPIIGMRTATHAFKIPEGKTYARYNDGSKDGGFGRQVLGEKWINHHGQHGKESTRGILAKGQETHPILRGIKDGDIWGPTDVYTVNLPLPGDSQPLVLGQVLQGMKATDGPVQGKKNDPMMPVAWTKTYKTTEGQSARVFTTTMGASKDLESEGFRRLLVQAAYWAVGLEDKVPHKGKTNVAIVGEYQPLPFGFGTFKKGVKPADLAK